MPRKKILSSKSQIIDVALTLIETEGLEAVSMRRLSKEMGVSSKTLYNYMLNADAVLKEILIHSFSEIYERVYAKMKELVGEGMEASVAYAKAYALALYDFARRHRNICAYLIGDGYEAYHNDAELRHLYDPFDALLMSMGNTEEVTQLRKILQLYEGALISLIRNHITGIRILDENEYLEMIDFLVERMFDGEPGRNR